MTLAELTARLPPAGSPWRARGLAVLAVLIALAVGYSVGKFSGPAKVETRDVERVVYKDKIVEVVKTVTVKEAAKTTILWRDRVITKDGTITEHVIEKSEADSKVTIAANTERTATLSGDKTSDRATITVNQAQWRVSLMVGGAVQQPFLAIPSASPLVFGTAAERRIFGGLWAGLWVMPQFGAGGVSLSFEF